MILGIMYYGYIELRLTCKAIIFGPVWRFNYDYRDKSIIVIFEYYNEIITVLPMKVIYAERGIIRQFLF
jgi:hypothetical protein